MITYAIAFALLILFFIGYINLCSRIAELRRKLNFEYVTTTEFYEHKHNSNADFRLLHRYLNVKKIEEPPKLKLQPKTKQNGEAQ